MDKLAIVKMVNALAGTQGEIDSVETTTGYQTLLVTFVDNAYNEIQVYRDSWKFLQKMVQAPLDDSTDTFTNTDVATIRFMLYEKAPLVEVPYESWIQQDWQAGKPRYYTVDPADGVITFNPSDASYLVDVYYNAVPDLMATGISIPVLPTRFHQTIVFKALVDLGTFLGNYDLIQQYSTKYSYELGQLLRSQNPAKRVRTEPFVQGTWYL